MALTIEHILDMKQHENDFGINVYDWFFSDLENNYLSKMNGTERNVSVVKQYDEEARSYIVLQLYCLNEPAAKELRAEFDYFTPVISEENRKQLKYEIN